MDRDVDYIGIGDYESSYRDREVKVYVKECERCLGNFDANESGSICKDCKKEIAIKNYDNKTSSRS